MKNKLNKILQIACVAVFALGGVPAAKAVPTAAIRITSTGGATTTVNDNGAGDSLNTTDGVISTSYTSSSFTVTTETSMTKPINGNAGLPRMNLNTTFSTLGASGGTLTITLSDTGFTGPSSSAFLSSLTSVFLPVGATATYQSYYKANGALFDLSGATLLGTLTATSAGTPLGNEAWSPLLALAAPFTLTEVITITATGGAVDSGTVNVRLATPDGGSTAVLIGFAFLGIEAVRRKLRFA